MSRQSTLAIASRIAGVTDAGTEILEALDLCLGVLDRSAWPEVAWGFSRLTSICCFPAVGRCRESMCS